MKEHILCAAIWFDDGIDAYVTLNGSQNKITLLFVQLLIINFTT